ncbi:MAG: 16S rRNA (guanine(966)-N(2))-methyltransferase RsmD [Acidobacteriota bacterium]
MRIIAGTLKGRRLKTPSWDGLRPTSDRLRETLFNILAPRLAGARVVDGYAGTGAIGIEAISRGAADVVFIDRDRRAQALVAENLAHCGVRTGYTIARADALRALEALAPSAGESGGASGGGFDVMLFDPPYDQLREDTGRVLAAAGRLLAPGGVIVLEHARRGVAPQAIVGLRQVREVGSGDSMLSFYERGRD